MVAVLKPIEARAITRPPYDNRHIECVSRWVDDNNDALIAYYKAMGKALPVNEDNNLTAFAKAQAYCAFCQCQWDRARGAF